VWRGRRTRIVNTKQCLGFVLTRAGHDEKDNEDEAEASQVPQARWPIPANHLFPTQKSFIMFEKFGRYAEKLATSAGQSRRGFLGRLSKGAAGVAGLLGGLLLFPGETVAVPGCTGSCRYKCPNGEFAVKGCRSDCTCTQSISFRNMTCFLYHTSCTPAQSPARTIRAQSPARTIRIEVWDGAVQDVSNGPPGWDYEVVDYDHLTSWRGSFDE
jgi:hypothetical protein